MRKIRIAVTGAVCAVVLGMAGVVAAAPASADRGGLNLWSYCTWKYGTPAQANNFSGTWNGWVCSSRYGVYGIDMNAACRYQYGQNIGNVAYLAWNSPTGWRCR